MRLLFLFILSINFVFASPNDNVGLELKNTALVKILNGALENYLDTSSSKLEVAAGSFEQVIQKELFQHNPVIEKLQQFLIIDLSKDLEYTVKWSPLNIETNISDKKIFVTSIDSKSLKVAIRIELDEFSLWGRSIEIIEKSVRFKNRKAYGGLYARFDNFNVSLNKDNKVQAVAIFNIDFKSSKAKVNLDKVYSNLSRPQDQSEELIYEKYNLLTSTPRFWVNFKNFYMPPPVLSINGETFEIDPQKIEDVILEEKKFLAKKLVAMAADFFANDLAEILNTSFLNKFNTIASSFKLVDYYDPYATCEEIAKSDLMNELQVLMKSMIYETHFELHLDRVETPKNEDLQLGFEIQLSLNEKSLGISPYIHNRKIPLGKLDYSQPRKSLHKHEDYDFALAISEPLMNSILNAGSDHQVYQNVIDQFMPMPGVKINAINLHFVNIDDGRISNSAIDVVAQIEVHFDELEYKSKTPTWGSWFYDSMAWSKNQIASLLESGKVYFPLQMRFYPKLINKGSRYLIQLNAIGPLNYRGIKNHYGYPYKKMYSVVENGIIERIKSDLAPQLKHIPEIDITSYLNLSGVQLKPVDVFTKNTGHLIIRSKIEHIDFQSISGNE